MRCLSAALIAAMLLIAGCDRGSEAEAGPEQAGKAIEAAAVARGLVTPLRDVQATGVFARETDRLCLVPAGERFQVGISVDYGDDIGCTATGTAAQSGAALRIELRDCAFDAKLEGDEIAFPARMPDACARFCRGRASLSALRAKRLSDAVSEARALRDAKGNLLCAS